MDKSVSLKMATHGLLITVLGAFLFALHPMVVEAYQTNTGSGTSTAQVGILGAPGTPTGSVTNPNVTLSWSAGTISNGGTITYYVERELNGGSTWFPACGTSPSSTITALTCSDNPGATSTTSYVYRVTSVYHTFSKASAVSAVITLTYATTTTTLASSLNPSVWGQSVTVTSTSTSGTAGTLTGSVTFQDAGINLPGCVGRPIASGLATCTTTNFAIGSHSLTAIYSGDNTFATSTSSVLTQVVNSASAGTWIGAGATNNWSDCANWYANTCPTAGSTLTFSGVSSKNSVVDASFAGTVTSLSINAGYTGTISQSRSLTLTGAFSQSAGAYTASTQILTLSGFSLSGGTFTASTGNTFVNSTFTITAGSFNANGGKVDFTGSSSATISCNSVAFSSVTFSNSVGSTKTVSSNCSLPLGNNANLSGLGAVAVSGTLTGSGILNFSGALELDAGGSITGLTSMTVGNLLIAGATANFSTYTSISVNSTFTETSGTFTAPPSLTVYSSFQHTAGTFTPGTGTVVLSGTSISVGGSTTFYKLTDSATIASTLTFAAGTTQTVTNNATLKGVSGQLLTLNSSVAATQFKINVSGTRTLGFLKVKDSNNTNATVMAATPNSTNLGNNTNWSF